LLKHKYVTIHPHPNGRAGAAIMQLQTAFTI